MNEGLDRKLEHLRGILAGCRSVCIGYSGGVDSAFLSVAALDVLGPDRVLAVTGRSPAYPGVQRQTAVAVAERFSIPHVEIETNELADPRYAENPTDRCYFCKTELWSQLARLATERRLATVVDGANADDALDHRPGGIAAREHGVRSPLQEAGLTKAEIRVASRARGLPTWDQPAAPCLSSRVPYGLAVTPGRLRQIEAAEEGLRALGFRELRVRHHGDAARVELSSSELERAAPQAGAIASAVKSAGFARVLLDVEGFRSGALNEGIPLVALTPGRR